MPRINNGTEIFQYLNTVELLKEQTTTPGNTTTSAAIDAADVTATVVAITNLTDGDIFALSGSGGVEVHTVDGTPTGTALDFVPPARADHESGANITELLAVDLGLIDTSGVQFGSTQNNTDINSANRRDPVGSMPGTVSNTFSFNLQGFNAKNFSLAFGGDDAEAGTGTVSDPWTTVPIGTTAPGLRMFRLTGTRFDGRTAQVLIVNATLRRNANVTIGGTSQPVLTISGSMTDVVPLIW